MSASIQAVNGRVWAAFEESLTPLASRSKNWRFFHHLPAVWLLPCAIVTSVASIALHPLTLPLRLLLKPPADPLNNFADVVHDSREWAKIGQIRDRTSLGLKDPSFLFGMATCAYQDSGMENCPDSQWAAWEKKQIPKNQRSGKSTDFYTKYQSEAGRQEILQRLQKNGANSYRFSLDWSQIEPHPDAFDEGALEVYVDFCKFLRKNSIQPVVTLHHFSEPLWFHNLGSFEKEENIQYFVRFAERVFPHLAQRWYFSPLVSKICTINEPAIDAFSRYVRGAFSPGAFFRFQRAGAFLNGALKAHVAVYERLKQMNSNVQIGIVHQYLKFLPSNPLTIPVTRYLNRLINEAPMRFFKEGVFELKIPFCCSLREEGFQPKTDFVGLQYYARPVIGLTGSTSYYEPMTKMPYREDPEGIYEAIIEAHKAFKAPVIVTESGISTEDPIQRSRYMERVLYAAGRAQEFIGKKNLLGYFLWSFADNWEWGMPHQLFGAYSAKGVKLSEEPKVGLLPFSIASAKARFPKQNVA